jgi:uncharacterized protein YbbC (DUF1343 family)
MVIVSPASALTLGVDRPEVYRTWLQGKRIGLVVNQASVSKDVHTIDKLQADGFRIVKLYALEHGVRGEGGAGEQIGDSVDEKTGLPILSLYGKEKKPSTQKLAGVDVIVFDIQDVGVRFYTYISSLGLIMEAAAEQHIPVVVFDRPNPNGDYVDGPLLKKENKSFVGAFPIPLVHGLTVGELAGMIFGEHWQHTEGLVLHVAAMKDYAHQTVVAPEVRPSPGLRSLHAIRIYPSIALFETAAVSLGRGTEHPYEQYGVPDRLLKKKGERIGAHTFVPHGTGKPALYEGESCQGEEFYSGDALGLPRFTTDLFTKALRLSKADVTDRRFLELLVGDKRVVEQMLKGLSYEEIRRGFASELKIFSGKREKYLLY